MFKKFRKRIQYRVSRSIQNSRVVAAVHDMMSVLEYPQIDIEHCITIAVSIFCLSVRTISSLDRSSHIMSKLSNRCQFRTYSSNYQLADQFLLSTQDFRTDDFIHRESSNDQNPRGYCKFNSRTRYSIARVRIRAERGSQDCQIASIWSCKFGQPNQSSKFPNPPSISLNLSEDIHLYDRIFLQACICASLSALTVFFSDFCSLW